MRMGRLRGLGVCCAAVAVAVASLAAEVDMKAGEWEVTARGIVEGAGEVPPQTKRMCLSPSHLVPHTKDNRICTISDTKVKDNTVSWSERCADPDSGMKAEGTGTVTYAGTSMEGTTSMTMTPPGQAAVKVTARLTGHRIGDCKQ